MVHGAPDNYQVQQKPTTFRLDDMAELAVRLRAIPSLDRLGDVLFFDSFENGLQRYDISHDDVGGDVSISGTHSRTGGFSCKLTAGLADTPFAKIQGWTFFPKLSKCGFEFSIATEPNCSYFEFYLTVDNGINRNWAGLKIDYINDLIAIYKEPGNYIPIITDKGLDSNENRYETFKLIIDFVNGTYDRLRFGRYTEDISNYPLHIVDTIYAPKIMFFFLNYGTGAEKSLLWLDDIIFTQNEP